ncbi:MAG: hypothetical protein AAGG50_11325 [Bacteroidota bacterium]
MSPLLRRLFLFSLFLTLSALALMIVDLTLDVRVPVIRPALPYALLVGMMVLLTIYVGAVGTPTKPGTDTEDERDDEALEALPLATPEGAARRVVEMVGVLHARGYERLRLGAGLAPSGAAWQCAIAAYAPDGTRLTDAAAYASTSGTQFFGWDDAHADDAEALAEKFTVRLPAIADAAYAADKAYARWYAAMLDASAPTGLPVGYADTALPPDRVRIVAHPDAPTVPLPPGGVL